MCSLIPQYNTSFSRLAEFNFWRHQLSWLKFLCRGKDTLCPMSSVIHTFDFTGTLSQCISVSVSLKDKLLMLNCFKKPLCNLQNSFSVLCCKRKLIACIILCVKLSNSHAVSVEAEEHRSDLGASLILCLVAFTIKQRWKAISHF